MSKRPIDRTCITGIKCNGIVHKNIYIYKDGNQMLLYK